MTSAAPHTKIVFGDMHNRYHVVRNLFKKLGLIDDDGNRVPGFYTVQLGDLVSLGYGEQETEFLRWVRPFIDVQLIGNHELPAIGPYPDYVAFQGWDERDIVAEQMVRAEWRKAQMEFNPDLWCAATSIGDWLITHAGASVAVLKELNAIGKSAEEIALQLNNEWIDHLAERTPDPIFIGTGQSTGGIFWHRIQYLRAGYLKMHVPQIVGHTPFDHNKKYNPPALQNKDGNLWCIDTAGSCCALITQDDGKTWEPVLSDYEVFYGEGRVRGATYVRGTDGTVYASI